MRRKEFALSLFVAIDRPPKAAGKERWEVARAVLLHVEEICPPIGVDIVQLDAVRWNKFPGTKYAEIFDQKKHQLNAKLQGYL